MKQSFLHAPLAAALFAGVAGAQSFTYTDFTSVAGVNMVGLASQAGNILRLQDNVTPAVGGDNRGGAWYTQALCVSNGFDTTFTYRMHTPSTTGGSDGLAFVIQNDPGANFQQTNPAPNVGAGNTALGRHASAIGYGMFATSLPGESIENSLAIELDTFNGGATWGDLDANHISVHTGGTGDNSQHENLSIGRADTATVVTNLNDAAVHTVRVVYTPGTLDVYLDGVLKLTTPYSFATGGTYLIGGTAGGLNLIGGTSAYVGFTSGAGSAREFRDILSWTWASNCGAPPTSFCLGDGTGAACPCANVGAAGNGCANSSFAAGANLAASGVAGASAGTDTLVLTASNIPGPGLFFQSTGTAPSALPFGDGLLCAAVGIVRLGVVFPTANVASYPGGLTPNPIHIGGGTAAGDVRHYQCWYRDAVTVCAGATHNLTQGLTLTWGP